jgi:nucleoside-diphosphate-sugar epimerase
MSTTGVYGDQAGGWVSETTPVNPTTPRAKRRVDAEQQIRRAVRPKPLAMDSGFSGRSPARLRATILRVPGIYAADRLPQERLRKGLPVADGDGDGYTNHIHADDLARLTLLSLMRMRSGRVLNTVDASAVTTGQWLDLVANALGLPTPPRVPRDQLAQYLTPMMLSFLTESRRINGRRALAELRTTLQWPTVESFLTSEAARASSGHPLPPPR